MSVTERARSLFDEDRRRRFELWVRADNSILYSLAFFKLCGHAVKVLLWAKMKVPLETREDVRRRKKTGQAKPDPPPFSFTYAEAELFGLNNKQFSRAIRELVEVGFLDVPHKGSGKHKDFSFYSWSKRWRRYGSDGFEYVPFPESLRHLPRGSDGRWASNRSRPYPIISVPPMADLRNTAEMCRCAASEKSDFNGRKVRLKDGFNGQKGPLVNGRKVPLRNTGEGETFSPWAEEEPLVTGFGEWAGEAAL